MVDFKSNLYIIGRYRGNGHIFYINLFMVKELTVLDKIALILVIVGGLNWGLYALNSSYDLVQLLLGFSPVLAQLVYLLVGMSAVYVAVAMMKFARQ